MPYIDVFCYWMQTVFRSQGAGSNFRQLKQCELRFGFGHLHSGQKIAMEAK